MPTNHDETLQERYARELRQSARAAGAEAESRMWNRNLAGACLAAAGHKAKDEPKLATPVQQKTSQPNG